MYSFVRLQNFWNILKPQNPLNCLAQHVLDWKWKKTLFFLIFPKRSYHRNRLRMIFSETGGIPSCCVNPDDDTVLPNAGHKRRKYSWRNRNRTDLVHLLAILVQIQESFLVVRLTFHVLVAASVLLDTRWQCGAVLPEQAALVIDRPATVGQTTEDCTQGCRSGVENLWPAGRMRPAWTFDMARIRIFVVQVRVQQRAKRNSMIGRYLVR